jgi:hypothetical protein
VVFVFLGFGVGVHASKQARQIVVVVVARLPVLLWRDCWYCGGEIAGAVVARLLVLLLRGFGCWCCI